MARAVFTEPFLDDVSLLPGYAEEAVWEKVELVASFPGVGSALVEPVVRAMFGPNCLKVNTAGYDVLYDRNRETDTVCFLGVVHQRAVR